jgi:hypothetical protein
MSLKCGVCGNKERFSSSARLDVDLTVDCSGAIVAHDLEQILSRLTLRPETCLDCGSRKLVESDFISDQEWNTQINQELERRRLEERLKVVKSIGLAKQGRRAS